MQISDVGLELYKCAYFQDGYGVFNDFLLPYFHVTFYKQFISSS